MRKEEWRDIPGFKGHYQVSNRGRIRSLDRMVRVVKKSGLVCFRTLKGRTPHKWSFVNGYCGVSFSIGGQNTHILVHRCVALAFIKNPLKKPDINHKDGVKTNNRVENLEWVTCFENSKHARKHGLTAAGTRHGCSILTNEQVREIRSLRASGVSNIEISKRFGVSTSTTSNVARGISWTHIK